MDSLTHIVLGACVGEVIGGKKLGKKAMILGALAQSIPDIDFLATLWMDPAEELLAHRGFTHSILFVVITTPFLALAAKRWFTNHGTSFRQWIFFFGIQLVIHDFLDAFNAYGTGWFEPFNHSRISFQALYVADPFFSFWPALAFVALLFLKTNSPKRILWLWVGLIGSILYLSYAVSNKFLMDVAVKASLEEQHIAYDRFLTTPTPLNSWLWWVVAEAPQGYYVGFRSRFDKQASMDFNYFPKNNSILYPVNDQEQTQHLKRFSQGYYTAEKWGDTLVFNDLRFGQNGWDNPKSKFVFNFYLSHPDHNKMVVQRGRFAHWDMKRVASFIRRVGGN